MEFTILELLILIIALIFLFQEIVCLGLTLRIWWLTKHYEKENDDLE